MQLYLLPHRVDATLAHHERQRQLARLQVPVARLRGLRRLQRLRLQRLQRLRLQRLQRLQRLCGLERLGELYWRWLQGL